ncbi:MAG: helix-turn-helix transcriptional regulator [Candidatus Kryptonium sp.]
MEERTIYVSVIPEIIRFLRENAGISVDEVAMMLRMDREEYLDLENGKKEPTIEQIKRLAKVLRRPVSAFFLSDIVGVEDYNPFGRSFIMSEACDRIKRIRGVKSVCGSLSGRRVEVIAVTGGDGKKIRDKIARLKEEFERRYPDMVFRFGLITNINL